MLSSYLSQISLLDVLNFLSPPFNIDLLVTLKRPLCLLPRYASRCKVRYFSWYWANECKVWNVKHEIRIAQLGLWMESWITWLLQCNSVLVSIWKILSQPANKLYIFNIWLSWSYSALSLFVRGLIEMIYLVVSMYLLFFNKLSIAGYIIKRKCMTGQLNTSSDLHMTWI